jgi:glycosyltransferase involved in cell wall biosynthesis
VKIGIFSPYLDTMSGGEKYMLTLAECLSPEHEVTIFWEKDKENDIREKAKHRFNFDLANITFAPTIFSSTISFIERFWESKKYDLIFFLSDGSIPFLACPVILHFQFPVEWVKVSLKTRVKMSFIQEVICNSFFTKYYIDRKFHIQSKVVYPPVDFSAAKKNLKKEKIILNVGRFGINHAGSSFKKQDILAEAFADLIKHGINNWKLVFIVSLRDEDKKNFNSFQKRYNSLPIEYLINPSSEELWEYYSKASIYWHASGYGENLEEHPDRAEHFGISTVEAMGSGAVPLVYNAGGQKEIVTQQQTGFLWNSTQELIAYTQNLISEPTKLADLSQAAKQAAYKYQKKNFCKNIKSILP